MVPADIRTWITAIDNTKARGAKTLGRERNPRTVPIIDSHVTLPVRRTVIDAGYFLTIRKSLYPGPARNGNYDLCF